MSNAVTRFLGDSPLRVLIKLVVLSLVAGFIMSVIGWRPWDVVDAIIAFAENVWELGFSVIYDSLEYILLGAAVVVPIFLIIRLFSYRSPRV